MTFEAERKLLKQYIEKFDTDEFSSSADDITVSPQDISRCRQLSARLKARLARKRKMEQSLKQTLENNTMMEDSTVIITQEQIDDLLSKAGL